MEATQPQDNGSLPLACNFNGAGNDAGDDERDQQNPAATPISRTAVDGVGEARTDGRDDDKNEGCK